jgi:hypothetical protein
MTNANNTTMTTLEKMNFLESKFNAPMDIIMQVIRHCEKQNLDVTQIDLRESK